jgi:cysteinyl-tRNA synthetase
VNLGTEKMSKSLGNTLTIETFLERHDPEALRLYLLQTHYRNPVELTAEGVAGMRRPLERFRELVDEAGRLAPTEAEPSPDGTLLTAIAAQRVRFETAMDDDFNTPQAIVALYQLAAFLAEERKRVQSGARGGHDFLAGVGVLIDLGKVLGLSMEGRESHRAQVFEPDQHARIDALVKERDEARQRRDWARADALRAELNALGVVLEDTPTKTQWKPKTGAPTAP